MITIRRSSERGHFDHGWLDTHHTFSFADYYDANWMGFGVLRVINEDIVQPAEGFGTHPHRDMEILTYVLEGALEHKDSMGNGSIIAPGEVQRMTAGTGVTHSEFNASKTDPVHLLQIWILPEKKGLEPGYEQKTFADDQKDGRLCLIASRDAREGSVTIHQDVDVYAALLGAGDRIDRPFRPGRKIWVQVARGSVTVNGQDLEAGDGAAFVDEDPLSLEGNTDAEVLVFDLPPPREGS